ncbi:MAG: hypothetical protein E7047_05370, partial [Lentisphaerae bacterium]|nr:hypothetical protein [Lentisphaerota bacterium]
MKSQGRNRNPYQGIDWKNQIRVTGCSHLHCSTAEEFTKAVDSGLEFATFANYYPSAPYYPAASIRENTFKIGQPSYILNGEVVDEYLDYRKLYTEWGVDASIVPDNEGELIFPPAPEGFLEAPNAEHGIFSDYNVYLHITCPGSFFCSGNCDRNRNSVLAQHGIHVGTRMPWRKAFDAMIDKLMIPDGGGIVINHPHWSHLPHDFLCEMLDYDDRVLGLEVLNAGYCDSDYTHAAESQWDEVLGTGRQCYGFCVQDHLEADKLYGRCILMPEERTVESCLRAYRQGRFYGAIHGQGLDFESVEFDGRTLRVRCDKEAIMLLLSHRGVLVELWTGRELVYTVPDADRSKDVFLRVTAMDKESGEKHLYSGRHP